MIDCILPDLRLKGEHRLLPSLGNGWKLEEVSCHYHLWTIVTIRSGKEQNISRTYLKTTKWSRCRLSNSASDFSKSIE